MSGGGQQALGSVRWTGTGRLLAGALVMALVVALLPGGAQGQEQPVEVSDTGTEAVTAQAGGFSDVPAGHVFAEDIEWLAATGITQGRDDGTSGLNDAVTRGAMAAFLYRFSERPRVPADTPGFTDVPPGHTFDSDIAWLAATGITRGRDDGTFGLNDAVTRGAMAAFLYRAAGAPPVTTAAPAFTDVPAGHTFATEIAWLAATGITRGRDDGTFGLNDEVTRGQMAAFLSRFDDWLLPQAGAVFAIPDDTAVELGWIAVPLDDVAYEVERAPGRWGPWEPVTTTDSGADGLRLDELDNGAAVFLRLRSVDDTGRRSLTTEPVGVTPVALPSIDPELTADTLRVTRSQVLAADPAEDGNSRVTLAEDVPIAGAGQLLVIEPSPPMPRGMLAEVLDVDDTHPEPGQRLLLTDAALDEVFDDPQIDWDVELTPQPVDDVGTALLSTAPQHSTDGTVTTVGLPTSALSCKDTGGIPLSPDAIWETGNPFPIELTLRNMRTTHVFDPGSRVFNRDPLLLMQVAGEVDTTLAMTAKLGVTCELSSRWRQTHPIFSATIGTVGGIPVTVNLEPAFSLTIAASGKIGFTETRYFAYTVEKDGDQPIDFRRAGSADPPELTATAGFSAEVFAGGDLSVLFGGGTGPANAAAGLFLEFGPALTASSTLTDPDCTTLDLDFRATGGIRLELWVKRWNLELASANHTLTQLAEHCAAIDAEPPDVAASPLPGVAADLDGYRTGRWSDPQVDGGWQRVDYESDDPVAASLRVRRLPDWWAVETLVDAFEAGESWFQGFAGVEVRHLDADPRFPDAQRALQISSTVISNEGPVFDGGPWAVGDERRYLLDHGDHVVEVLWRSRDSSDDLLYAPGVVVDPAGETVTDSLRVTASGTVALPDPVDPRAVDWRSTTLEYRAQRGDPGPGVAVTLTNGSFDGIAPDGRHLRLTLLDVGSGDATDDGNLEALLLFDSSRTEYPFVAVMAAQNLDTWRQLDFLHAMPDDTVRLVAANRGLFAVAGDDTAIEARWWSTFHEYFTGVG